MIHPHVRFEGFDAASFARLVETFAGTRSREPGAARRRGTLVIVVDEDERVLGAFHTLRGRMPQVSSAKDPEAAASVHGARRVLVVREGAAEELAERLSLRLRRSDDLLAQGLTLLHAIRELVASGALRPYPPRFLDIPLPTAEAVRRTFDLALPNDRAALLVLADGPELATAVAVRRREGSIDAVVGPKRIAEWTGPLGGDLRRDHRYFVEAIERHLAPVHLAISADARTFERLLHGREPGALGAAVAVREIVVDPAPAWAGLALGADVVRSLFVGLARALHDVDLGAVLPRGSSRPSSMPPPDPFFTRVLGFDPASALTRAFDRFRTED